MKNNLFSVRNLILLGIFILVAVVSTFFLIGNSEQNQDRPSLKPDHELSYYGSIGIGIDKVNYGVESFKKNYQYLDGLNLYWYDLADNGTFVRDSSVSTDVEKDVIAFAKKNNIKISVGIGDHGEAEKADVILSDENKQKKHISKIISLLVEKGYDGVIIDYEDLRNEQEEAFTNYMRKLSLEVHFVGKTLGISAPIETTGRVFHGINVVAVSEVVDRMHLVSYEEFGSETEPGPIASIDWVNTIIKNIVDQGVSPSKLVLGTAHSGHDWIISPSKEFFKDTTTKGVLSIFSEKNATLKWDEKTQSRFFEYKDDSNSNHIVWLEDSKSFKAKIGLAKSYKIQGIFIWYLGGEDNEIWEMM